MMAAVLGVPALGLAFVLMILGACVDRYFALNSKADAILYIVFGFVVGLCIFILGMIAGGGNV